VVTNDPRHGRWILPLIIAGMVILTYTFVNSLEPAASPSGTTRADPPFPTDPTSTTTTLPRDVADFMVTLDIFENQATAFRDEVININSQWEGREILFAEARTAFVEAQADLDDWENDVAAVTDVPPDLAEAHVELLIEVGDLSPTVGDIVVGLEAPDDGALRRAAVAEFQVQANEVLDAIQAIRDLANQGTIEQTTTTGVGA
jgi:hypothetical protein